MRWKLFLTAGTALLVAIAADQPARGSSIEVQLKLPQKARLDLKGKKSIAVAPFQVETKEDTQRFQGRDIDVQKEFARYLVKDVGVAAVPGSSFYKTGAGSTKLRFCFCKKDATLAEADQRMETLVPAAVR